MAAVEIQRLAFLLASITITYACDCGRSSNYVSQKDEFCEADYVSHAKVMEKTSETDIDGRLKFHYIIEHIKVFRMPKGLSDLGNKYYSESQTDYCGIELDVGKEYLISGKFNVHDDEELLSSCQAAVGLLKEWNQVSVEESYKLSTYQEECLD